MSIWQPPTAGSPVLQEAVRRLIEAYRPLRVYLFGSVARGEAGPDSDYDLMLVVPDDAEESRRDSSRVYEILHGLRILASVLIWTESAFNSRTGVVASLPATILREGILLHMPPDAALIAETREWLVKASRDLAAAETVRNAGMVEHVLFLAQQAAEKSLKAYLTWRSQPFKKTHEMAELGEQAAKLDPALEETAARAKPLSVYAWRFRYPGAPYEPTVEEAEHALAAARDVFAAIRDRVAPEARP